MAWAAYADVHTPRPLVEALRAAGFDVLTAQEDHPEKLNDRLLLERATALDRVLLSNDSDFFSIAAEWQCTGRDFAGVIILKLDGDYPMVQFVDDIKLILEVEDQQMWLYVVPFASHSAQP
uniref:DUF5615 domain-containing protein n=1 Tax=Schlesneria paludicola TaxID=360056 RepID=A0A7C2P082_9PLAN